MAIVEFQDVTLEVEGKSFLKNVSFRLDAGESMAITGPPGCGRSLVLRLVQGLPGLRQPHESGGGRESCGDGLVQSEA